MRSPIMEEEILTRLSCGESLASIGQDDHMPNIGTVLRWCQEDSSFKERYDLARESQASAYFEQLVVISDGRTRMADPQRDRLRVDARKWVLSRMDRSKYGDRSDINLGGQPGAPIETKAVNEDSLTPEEQKTLRELGRKLATGGSK